MIDEIDVNIEKDLKEIKKLKHLESYTIPESDYGKADVFMINETYIFFGIPMYGGEPYYEFSCNKRNLKECVEKIYSYN